MRTAKTLVDGTSGSGRKVGQDQEEIQNGMIFPLTFGLPL